MRRGSVTRGKRNTRGATLIEALIAVVVLALGTAAIAELLKYTSDAHRTMSFQTASIDLYARLAAEIQDAHCDVDDVDFTVINIDPGLTQGDGVFVGDAPFGAAVPPAGSKIQSAGIFREYTPDLSVRYQATWVPAIDANVDGLLDGPPGYNIDVEVRQITGDATQDNPATLDGYWIRNYPISKVCNIRLEDTNGRGEFY